MRLRTAYAASLEKDESFVHAALERCGTRQWDRAVDACARWRREHDTGIYGTSSAELKVGGMEDGRHRDGAGGPSAGESRRGEQEQKEEEKIEVRYGTGVNRDEVTARTRYSMKDLMALRHVMQNPLDNKRMKSIIPRQLKTSSFPSVK